MELQKVNFPRNKNAEFLRTLRQRVNVHFKESQVTRFASPRMVTKTVCMIMMFLVPYLLLIFGAAPVWWQQLILWAFMGLGSAGIGLSVMHDANHGAYSRNARINRLLGRTLNILGGFDTNWKIQHNVLHHTYTNVAGMDHDIQTNAILRFSPHDRRYWFHRFQYIYAWFFYSLMTLYWMTVRDFTQLNGFRNKGVGKVRPRYGKLLTQLIAWKGLYYLYIIVLPILVVPGPWYWVIIGWVLMHMLSGLVLSAVFQTAHVVPQADFPLPCDEGNMENSWAIHQLLTTANFGPKSRLFSWFIGGLNFQIEHHLFPNICHVHYRRISSIVRDTAEEFGLPYHSQPNFIHALREHTRFLRALGRPESSSAAA